MAAGTKELNDRTANFALAGRRCHCREDHHGDQCEQRRLDFALEPGGQGAADATQPVASSLGCDPAEYVAAGVAGKIAVVQRGTCARVARAIFGQQAGAAAVVMINNAAVLPPFEGRDHREPG